MPLAQRVTRQSTKRQVSKTRSVPAPVGGLNAVDPIANMPEEDAVVMDNWFPLPSSVRLRNGHTRWSTGYGGWVQSLMPYANASGEKLFAASGTGFYNATSTGAVGAAVQSGLTNARWESVNFATSGGQFMYVCNGVDKPRLYDGTTWTAIDSGSTPAITGVTTTKLRNPNVWKNRIWFIEDLSLRAWYLPTQSIGGAAHQWDLSSQFSMGGYLQAVVTASIATSSTFEDYIGFITTEGQIAIYNGTDPDQAGLFVLQGVYNIGKPVGRRCYFKYGADTLIICSDGVVSLANLVTQGRGKKNETVSYKIQNLINNDIQSYNANFGWQGITYPLGNKIIVNVPQAENSTQYQYVMNTITNAWCRFTNWNAACFAVLGDVLYFGGSTYVAKADIGRADNSAVITGSLLPAFSYLRTDRQKYFTAIRILFNATSGINPLVKLNTDFDTTAPMGVITYTPSHNAPWNTSPWDTTSWTTSPAIRKAWQTVSGIGFAASLFFYVSSLTDIIEVYSIDYLYQEGGVF